MKYLLPLLSTRPYLHIPTWLAVRGPCSTTLPSPNIRASPSKRTTSLMFISDPIHHSPRPDYAVELLCIYSTKLPYLVVYALHRTKLHSSVTFAALVLLQRLKARFPTARGSSGHRLFISAFMIASKVICDDTYSNKSWGIVGQGMFQLREVNQMEREMCQYLDWELNVEPSTLNEFEEMDHVQHTSSKLASVSTTSTILLNTRTSPLPLPNLFLSLPLSSYLPFSVITIAVLCCCCHPPLPFSVAVAMTTVTVLHVAVAVLITMPITLTALCHCCLHCNQITVLQ